MKKIGLVGGISWTSTLDYYKFINEGVYVVSITPEAIKKFENKL